MVGLILLLVLVLLACLILPIITLAKASSQEQKLESIKTILSQVREQLYTLDARVKDLSKEDVQKPDTGQKWKEQFRVQEKPATIPEPEKEKPVIAEEPVVPDPVIPPVPQAEKEPEPIPVPVPVPALAATEETKEPLSIMEEKPKTDWEEFIGENLVNKIGIGVLVLGISFFVKFAIDKDWINEAGRVVIGLISGGILIGLAHYTRNTYRSFSSVLVGGGLTVFYFTIAFAFHQYHLLSQQAAFIIMIAITALAVLLSLLYDRIELGILATAGGFVTPFLVSTGQNNYIALFTYLAILNSGLLVLSWFKRWKLINIIALFFTIIIYGGWLIRQISDSRAVPFESALFFATLFYLLSVAINIINNIRLNKEFGAFDFILLLSINFLYYTAGLVILDYNFDDGEYQGLFTAGLGIFNLVLAGIFFKSKKADRNFIHLLIGLTITFISLAAPVQLDGNHITLFWAAETVVLFWLYQRTNITLLKIASLILVAPLMISLFLNWSQVYTLSNDVIPVVVNKGFVTTLVTAIAFLLYYFMLKKEKDTLYLPGMENNLVRSVFLPAGVAMAYAAGAWEMFYQFATRYPHTGIASLYIQVYSFAFIIALLIIFRKSPSFTLLKFMLTIAAVVLYIFSMEATHNSSLYLLYKSEHAVHFLAHWAGAVLLIWLLYSLISNFRKQQALIKDYAMAFTWVMAPTVIFVLSIEMYYGIIWSTYTDTEFPEYWENLYYKAGLSILWGICSFMMMWLGMKYKFRTLRIVSLTLFTITLVKLFVYDIQRIPPGGKIAAFILLGVLLLIVSFMYQRLRRIIIDDNNRGS